MSSPILKITDLSVNIDRKLILDKVSFDVDEGKIITVVGPNGGGKTTLARCILKLIKPSSGKIWVKENIKIGYMPQKISLNPNLPINVITFLKLSINHKPNSELLLQTIHEIGIQHILHTPLQKISGGEMQKVLLAKALLEKPNLLVLDEPSQGIDINGQLDLYKLIDKLCKEKNMSMLIISHDLFMVMKSTNHVICLNQHICCEGTANYVNQQENFQKLFGYEALNTFSVYDHNHDHTHP
ncbi:MAG: metal ABC transporter ATP-binding protein [Rickettsiales bacterium]|jgi:zinc transport system ATP-binding protein|nr:metal ABC transporter ATP-binding protein [Rickettsiales bacterium]